MQILYSFKGKLTVIEMLAHAEMDGDSLHAKLPFDITTKTRQSQRFQLLMEIMFEMQFVVVM